jgi:thioesterase-3
VQEGQISRIKVRGYHTDIYGHVNNARYLEFYEENRWAWFDGKIDISRWAKKGLTFAIVNINVNYRKQIPLGATIEVRSRIEKIGSRSATLRQEIFFADNGVMASDALVTFVIIGKDGAVVKMDSDMEEIRAIASLVAELPGK